MRDEQWRVWMMEGGRSKLSCTEGRRPAQSLCIYELGWEKAPFSSNGMTRNTRHPACLPACSQLLPKNPPKREQASLLLEKNNALCFLFGSDHPGALVGTRLPTARSSLTCVEVQQERRKVQGEPLRLVFVYCAVARQPAPS